MRRSYVILQATAGTYTGGEQGQLSSLARPLQHWGVQTRVLRRKPGDQATYDHTRYLCSGTPCELLLTPKRFQSNCTPGPCTFHTCLPLLTTLPLSGRSESPCPVTNTLTFHHSDQSLADKGIPNVTVPSTRAGL